NEKKVTAVSGSNYRFNSSLVSFLSSNKYACSGILYQNQWKIKARLGKLNDEIKPLLSKLIYCTK
ncbi:9019_t:CDS:1, partial [Gigaspora rosea]